MEKTVGNKSTEAQKPDMTQTEKIRPTEGKTNKEQESRKRKRKSKQEKDEEH